MHARELVQPGDADHPQGHRGWTAQHHRPTGVTVVSDVREGGDKSRTDEPDAAKVDVDDARLVVDELAGSAAEFPGVRKVDVSKDLNRVDMRATPSAACTPTVFAEREGCHFKAWPVSRHDARAA